MKCSLQYGHLLCKYLNNYDWCMLYNCIMFCNLKTGLCFGFFFFHRDNCLNKAFSFATDYDSYYNYYYRSSMCNSFSENDAEKFFEGGKLE